MPYGSGSSCSSSKVLVEIIIVAYSKPIGLGFVYYLVFGVVD